RGPTGGPRARARQGARGLRGGAGRGGGRAPDLRRHVRPLGLRADPRVLRALRLRGGRPDRRLLRSGRRQGRVRGGAAWMMVRRRPPPVRAVVARQGGGISSSVADDRPLVRYLRRATGVFQYTRQAVRLVWETDRWLLAALAVLTLVAGGVPA